MCDGNSKNTHFRKIMNDAIIENTFAYNFYLDTPLELFTVKS